jgi:hypothetical protein
MRAEPLRFAERLMLGLLRIQVSEAVVIQRKLGG